MGNIKGFRVIKKTRKDEINFRRTIGEICRFTNGNFTAWEISDLLIRLGVTQNNGKPVTCGFVSQWFRRLGYQQINPSGVIGSVYWKTA